MANPLTTFIKAIIGKNSGSETVKEIEEASRRGEMAARNAAKRMGIEQVEIDAEVARKAAQEKTTEKEDAERIN